MSGAYCSFVSGHCDFGANALVCKTKSTVFCRNLRDKIEKEKKEKEGKHDRDKG